MSSRERVRNRSKQRVDFCQKAWLKLSLIVVAFLVTTCSGVVYDPNICSGSSESYCRSSTFRPNGRYRRVYNRIGQHLYDQYRMSVYQFE